MKKIVSGVLLVGILLLIGFYLFAPNWLVGKLITVERVRAGLVSRHVDVEGTRIQYLEGGQGEVVLMIHGFGADKDNWLRFAPLLSKHYRVIAPDLPGFGESGSPQDQAYDVPSQVTRLIVFIETLRLKPVHLVGNSMGGQIAAVLASQRPDLVTSLALFDPLGIEQTAGVDPSPMMQSLLLGKNLMLPNDFPEFEHMLSHLFYKRPWLPGIAIDYFAEQWLARRKLNTRIFTDITEQYVALEPLLPSVLAPTLVLWGAEDRILPAAGAPILAAGIPRSTLVIMEQCGHLPMLEKPRETAQHYQAFLNALPDR